MVSTEAGVDCRRCTSKLELALQVLGREDRSAWKRVGSEEHSPSLLPQADRLTGEFRIGIRESGAGQAASRGLGSGPVRSKVCISHKSSVKGLLPTQFGRIPRPSCLSAGVFHGFGYCTGSFSNGVSWTLGHSSPLTNISK